MKSRNEPSIVVAKHPYQRHARPAVAHLTRSDPRLARIIRVIGPPNWKITPSPFIALVGAIVHQQVSMAAAVSMQRRLRAACANRRMTPASLSALTPGELRAAGMSRQKARYLHAVAAAFTDGTLKARKLKAMSDIEVLAATTALPGIGRWTAEMLLMFSLQRPDVWPVDDLGIRKAVQLLIGAREPLPKKDVEQIGEPWRPYRSFAAWYLWRSLEGEINPGISVL